MLQAYGQVKIHKALRASSGWVNIPRAWFLTSDGTLMLVGRYEVLVA